MSGINLFDEEMPGIPEYMSGKSIFITGGAGFLGKLLIEKILRSCSGVDKIYLLLRPKKGLDAKERINNMSTTPVFDRLHAERPGDFLKKIIPIAGDMSELNLGISEEDKQVLINSVAIIFHVAATVRFDQPLKEAIIMNTRGTREMCNLALEMKKIEIVTHVSTAYAHCHNKKTIGERMYPAEADWRQVIEIAEKADTQTLNIITQKYMGTHPNTYTFTKSISEQVVFDLLDNKIPNLIMRPTIVVSTYKDPMPGWIDNFNGPVGLMLASGTGLIRINLIDDAIVADFVPADVVIKAMLVAMWKTMNKSAPNEMKNSQIYNITSNGISSFRYSDLIKSGLALAWKAPMSTCIWYPSNKRTNKISIYYIYVILFHLIPAVILDTLLKLINQKPKLVKLHRLIYVAQMALVLFMFNQWHFENDLTQALEDHILEKDKETFSPNGDDFNKDNFYLDGILGGKKYLLKENMDSFDSDYRKFVILYFADMLLDVVLGFGILYLFFYTMDIPSIVLNRCYSYLDGLNSSTFTSF